MQNIEALKQQVAQAALAYVPENVYIGVGTGSTVNYFIAALAQAKLNIKGAVASSLMTEQKLRQHGIAVVQLLDVHEVPIYIDSADEALRYGQLIKGGGGALTREKILANCAKKFVCIIDERKLVQKLGKFPVPIEVLPMARSFVGREITKLGGDPHYREKFTTDNGNIILDVANLHILQPIAMETQLNNISGVISNGIFALRPADVLLVAGQRGLEQVL